MDILEELKKLTETLTSARIDYALCGGLAIAVYAKPRATLDIDLMIEPGVIDKAGEAVQQLGFKISGPAMKFKNGSVIIHRFVKIDEESGEHLVLDLLPATAATREALDGRVTVEWEGGRLDVVSPRGLILLKSLRNSGQDRDDIEYLRSLDDED